MGVGHHSRLQAEVYGRTEAISSTSYPGVHSRGPSGRGANCKGGNQAGANGFVSTIFLVPKKDGQFRPIINLKPLNRFMRKHHFKMEGMHVVRDLLQQGDWMARLDLKDAYFAVISQESLPLPEVEVASSHVYKFQCLPFGLTSAPRTFAMAYKLQTGQLCITKYVHPPPQACQPKCPQNTSLPQKS